MGMVKVVNSRQLSPLPFSYHPSPSFYPLPIPPHLLNLEFEQEFNVTKSFS